MFIKHKGKMTPVAQVIKQKAQESEKPQTAEKAVTKKTTTKKKVIKQDEASK